MSGFCFIAFILKAAGTPDRFTYMFFIRQSSFLLKMTAFAVNVPSE